MRKFFSRHVSTKTAVSGISYEKIVQEKDPGNRENDALVPSVLRGGNQMNEVFFLKTRRKLKILMVSI